MAKIGLPNGSRKWSIVREMSVKSQRTLKKILSVKPDTLPGVNLIYLKMLSAAYFC